MRPATGILMMIAAVTIFTAMGAFIKAADRVPAGQAVFFRAGVSMPVILLWLIVRGQLSEGLRTSNWRGHAVRGLAGSVAMGLGFAALKFLPFPEVTGLRFVTPILIVVFAAMMLGERIRLVRITAVVVGLIGVAIILAPRLSLTGQGSELFGAALVLGSATLAALAQIFVKSMVARENPAAIAFYFAATATTLSLLTIPFGWVWPTPWEFLLLISAGVVGGIGQLVLTNSYRYADAGALAPFTYVSMLWAILIGWIVFSEIPTVPMLAGSGLIIASGIAIWLRERRLGRGQVAEGKVGAKGLQ